MADLDSTRVYGDLVVTGEAYAEGNKLENVSLTGGTNVTITGTYPNLTITSTDTNTTYSAGNGLTLSGTTFSLPVATSGSGSFVTSITQTATGITANLGTPPNTTYSNITAAEITAGTASTLRTLSGATAKLIADRNVGTANPLMDGTVSVGTSLQYARQDHRHPVDTSRAAASHTHGNISNTGAIGTTASRVIETGANGVLQAKAAGTTSQYLRGDGAWGTPPNTTYAAMSIAEGEAGTATASRTVRADYLKQIIEHYIAQGGGGGAELLFIGELASTYTAVNAWTWTTLPITAVYDPYSAWDAVNYRYSIPTGYYLVQAAARVERDVSFQAQVDFYSEMSVKNFGTSWNTLSSVRTIRQSFASSSVHMRVNGPANNRTIGGQSSPTHFAVYKVGDL